MLMYGRVKRELVRVCVKQLKKRFLSSKLDTQSEANLETNETDKLHRNSIIVYGLVQFRETVNSTLITYGFVCSIYCLLCCISVAFL